MVIAAVVCWSGQAEAQDSVFVRFHMNGGLPPVDVELFGDTPMHQANFLNYVTSDRYDNSMFQRSVPGFVLQGGSFTNPVLNPVSPDLLDPNGVAYPPGYPFAGSFMSATDIVTDSPVTNEIGRSNERGTLALALPSDNSGPLENAGTSGFFINVLDNPGLDSDFTVFGQVVAGMDLVDAMNHPGFGLVDIFNLGPDVYANALLPNFFIESPDGMRDPVGAHSFGEVPLAWNAQGQFYFPLVITDVEVLPIPEPGTMAVMAVGSSLLVGRRRLKRRAAA